MNKSMKSTEILVRIRKIIRAINLESSKIHKEYGVSIPQLLCINYLSTKENFQATHKEITNYLQLNSSTTTGIINRLEKKGLAARLPKKDGDKRNTYIVLTYVGMTLLKSTPPLLHDLLAKNINNLPDDRVNDIIRSLDFLIEYIDAQNIDASPVITVEDDLTRE